MSIPNRQIGWSNESNLLWNISSQLDRLTKVIANLSPGGGTNIYNSNGTLTGNRELSGAGNELKFKDVNQFYVQTSAFNTGQFVITDTEFKTIYNTNVIGLKLDFANDIYQFGKLSGINTGYIEINSTAFYQYLNGNIKGIQSEPGLDFYLFGDFNNTNKGTSLSIDDANDIIITSHGGLQNGIALDYSSNVYQFGKWNGGNQTFLTIDDATQTIKTTSGSTDIGLKLNFANTTYQLGQLTGGNTTYLTVNDAATYPVQLTGTNISSGTAGAASGQFLKIKVGGVDYKIALLNP